MAKNGEYEKTCLLKLWVWLICQVKWVTLCAQLLQTFFFIF